MARKPLSARPLDLIYFTFFLIHIPASLTVDFQVIYPPSLVPRLIQNLIPLYLSMTNDPLIDGAFKSHHTYAWLRSFLWLEMLFQLPVFIIGARALWNDNPRIYLLLLIYGASTATTVLPCIATLFAIPSTSSIASSGTLTSGQLLVLLSSYGPFLIVPLVMTVDMARRIWYMLDFARYARASATRSKREE